MSSNRLLILLIYVGIFVSVLSPPLYGAGRGSLDGISGVAVITRELSAEMKGDGLTEKQVRTVIEEKLEAADIEILNARNWAAKMGGAYLFVKVISSKSKTADTYAVFIDIELYQTVVLLGRELGKKVTTTAATWSVGKLLPCTVKEVEVCVLAAASELTDIFINEYRAVNPR